jgi:hypothetical protein
LPQASHREARRRLEAAQLRPLEATAVDGHHVGLSRAFIVDCAGMGRPPGQFKHNGARGGALRGLADRPLKQSLPR